MKRISTALIVPLALYATNGDNLIGVGAKSRALASAVTASYIGDETIFTNPALLNRAEAASMTLGATLFVPVVDASNGAASGAREESDSGAEVIPYLGYTNPVSEDTAVGIGLFSVSGMGVDYTDAPQTSGLAGMQTHLAFAKLTSVVSFRSGDFSFGGGPDLAWGRLKMRAQMPQQAGSDGDSDTSVGFHIGAAYDFGEHWRLGAVYVSKVTMDYEGVFDFNGDGTKDDLKLAQPVEYGVGLSYREASWHIEADYRFIGWSGAEGYKQFQWDDQHLLALGGGVNLGNWALRAGYSYAESPLHDKEYQAGSVSGTPMPAQSFAFFNLVGFPAIAEHHIAAGAGYALTKALTLDTAFVYAPKVTETAGVIEASNEQYSATLGLEYKIY